MMDEKLQNLWKTKKLQDEVIMLRTETPSFYDEYLKRAQSIQLKRLLNVQINIPVTEITIPDKSSMPTINQTIQPKYMTEDVEAECKDLQTVLDFIQ